MTNCQALGVFYHPQAVSWALQPCFVHLTAVVCFVLQACNVGQAVAA